MIGERIRLLRKKKNMTQEQVAVYLNAAKSTVSQYENDVNEPDLKTVMKLADLFGVTVDYMLGRVEPPKEKTEAASTSNMLLRERLTEEEAEYLQESLAVYRKLKAKKSAERGEPR